jgi:hypothetical protein
MMGERAAYPDQALCRLRKLLRDDLMSFGRDELLDRGHHLIDPACLA